METMGTPMRVAAGENIALTASGDVMTIATSPKASGILNAMAKTSAPFRTVELAAAELPGYLNTMPRLLTEILSITVEQGTVPSNLELEGFYGPGALFINGTESILHGGINIERYSVYVNLSGFDVRGAINRNGPIAVYSVLSPNVILSNIIIDGTQNSEDRAALTGVRINNCGMAQLIKLQVSNVNTALMSTGSAVVSALDCTGSGNNIGIFTYCGGAVLLCGTTPVLMGGTSNLKAGGMIVKPDGTPYAPLEWHDLPLQDGWIPDTDLSRPQYAKTAQGYVIIRSGSIRSTAGDYSITSNPIVARLPEGYRPLEDQLSPAVVCKLENADSQSSAAAFLVVDSGDGYIQIHVSTSVHGSVFIFPTIVYPISQ